MEADRAGTPARVAGGAELSALSAVELTTRAGEDRVRKRLRRSAAYRAEVLVPYSKGT